MNSKAAEGEASQPEPFAQQARHFTELRMLNREMQIVMQSVDRGGNVLGTALHPKGNIAVELVRSGLAKVAERSLAVVTKYVTYMCSELLLSLLLLMMPFLLLCRYSCTLLSLLSFFSFFFLSSSFFFFFFFLSSSFTTHAHSLHIPILASAVYLTYLPPVFLSLLSAPMLLFECRETAQALRVAEREAQAAHRFLWTDYVPPKPHPSRRVFEGVVLEVISGDTLIVLEDSSSDPDGIERRITLSSIRVPRLGNQRANADGSAPTGAEPWAAEGRDLLKARLIGRRVTVSVEYERGNGGKSEGDDATRTFATVKYQGRNAAILMVSEGLATATKHRADEERSDEYDQLLLAEAEAISKKKGQHGTAAPPAAPRINDLTTDGK
jgi:endonuclease YncB( thermonuclease family)